MYWVKYHLRYLRMLREAVKAVAKAVHDLDPLAEVYLIGGAAEGRLTVLSDVDVLVVIKRGLDTESLNEFRRAIYARAVDVYNLPWDCPVEIHIMTGEEFNEAFVKRGKKAVKIET
jgi:predicted nucleotidyltransferase